MTSTTRLRRFAVALALTVTATACSSSSEPVDEALGGEQTEQNEDTGASNDTTDDTDTDTETGDVADPAPAPADEVEPGSPTFTSVGEPGVGGRITSITFDQTNPDRLFVGGDLLGIALTEDFGASWQSTTGLANWEIGDITTVPTADGRIWTGSLSGPQSSVDGVEWELSRNGMPATSDSQFTLPIEAVIVDPTNNARLLAFAGNQRNWTAAGAYDQNGFWEGDGSVWETTDSGQNWQQLSVVSPGGNIRAAAFNADATVLYAAVADAGLFVSTNSGQSWSQTANGLPHANAYDVTSHPTDPNTAWVSLGEGPQVDGDFIAGGIWKTTDGGTTWTDANAGLSIVSNSTAANTGSFHQIVVAPSNPDRLYTSNVAPGQAAIYRSDDGAQTWQVVADDATPRPDAYEGALRAFDIGVHPADADRVAIGSDDTLLGSTDGGQTWTDLTTVETAEGFFSGTGYSGLVSTDIVFNPADPDKMILLGFDGGNFIQTIDGAETWRRTVQDISQWGGGVEAAYSPSNPDVIYVLLGQFSNFRGIGVSTNGGASFDLVVGADDGLPEIGNVTSGATGLTVTDFGGGDTVLTVVGETLYIRQPGADSFSIAAQVPGARDVAVTPDGTIYASSGTGVLSSIDQGTTFAPVANAPAGISTLFTSPSEPSVVYGIAFREGAGGLHRYDGAEWTQLFDDEFAHGVAVDPTNPDNIAIVTTEPPFNDISSATGVHLSNDGGQTWTVATDGLPMLRLRTAEFDPADPDRLVVGTTGRGFYEISFSAALNN